MQYMHSNSSHFRYRLHFKKETQEEIDQRKYTAKTKILVPVDEVYFLYFHIITLVTLY